jgi:hypothetical protein
LNFESALPGADIRPYCLATQNCSKLPNTAVSCNFDYFAEADPTRSVNRLWLLHGRLFAVRQFRQCPFVFHQAIGLKAVFTVPAAKAMQVNSAESFVICSFPTTLIILIRPA